ELRRERRLRLDPGAAERMLEREPGGMEELTLEAELARSAIDRVTRDGQVDGSEVDADLVGSSRLEPDVQQRVARQQLDEVEMRDRVAGRVGVERVPQSIAPVAADRSLDPARARARMADYDGE